MSRNTLVSKVYDTLVLCRGNIGHVRERLKDENISPDIIESAIKKFRAKVGYVLAHRITKDTLERIYIGFEQRLALIDRELSRLDELVGKRMSKCCGIEVVMAVGVASCPKCGMSGCDYTVLSEAEKMAQVLRLNKEHRTEVMEHIDMLKKIGCDMAVNVTPMGVSGTDDKKGGVVTSSGGKLVSKIGGVVQQDGMVVDGDGAREFNFGEAMQVVEAIRVLQKQAYRQRMMESAGVNVVDVSSASGGAGEK